MDRVTISKAIHQIEELIELLDDAYWEASTISNKDLFYDLIHSFQLEVGELSKLSVEDHYMAYEPITIQVKNTLPKLKNIHSDAEHWVSRSKTASEMNTLLPGIIQLLGPQP